MESPLFIWQPRSGGNQKWAAPEMFQAQPIFVNGCSAKGRYT